MASMARCGMEVCEMQEQPRASATTSDAVDEQLPQAPAAAPSIEMRANDIVISLPAYGEWWRDGRTRHTGVRTPRRTTSSAPGCPVRSTTYERGGQTSARLYL